MDCWWYITSPPGQQVELIVFDVETSVRDFYIYDYPSLNSTTSTLASFRGSTTSSFHFTSSSGGLMTRYDDKSGTSHSKGVVFEAHILGMLGEYL